MTRLPHLDRLFFTKHLSIMLSAGIPLSEAIESLIEQSGSSALKKILHSTVNELANGQTLSSALAKFPRAFDPLYLSLIDVGEESGKLEKTLQFLSDQLKNDYVLRKKIQGALLYPGFVLAAALIMGGFISIAILPKLVGFFSAFEVDLPLATRVLLTVSIFMKNYGIIFFVGLIGAMIGLILILSSRLVKPWWHRQLLRLPLIGRLIQAGQLARFSRNLSTLLKAGIPISRALDSTAKSLSNWQYSVDLIKINRQLQQGKNIGMVLSQNHFFEFPPLVAKMISVGEKTGKLETTLEYLTSFYEDVIDDTSKNLTTVLEPVLLISIGLIVGFLALAIISPIYELTASVRQ